MLGSSSKIREATVTDIDIKKGVMKCKINLSQSDVLHGEKSESDVPIPGSWMGPNGEFSGGCPALGSTIWLALGQGGRWAPMPYVPNNDVFTNTTSARVTSQRRNQMSALRPGRWLTQVAGEGNIRMFLDPVGGIELGNPEEALCIDPIKKIYSAAVKNIMAFSDASRSINGAVKRDLSSNSNRDITGSALMSHEYDDSLFTVGLDPWTKPGLSTHRNPPFAEVRETVYEYCDSFGFTNDADEATQYDTGEHPEVSTAFNRRESRADTLSLTQLAPNQLIETIKGTVVDIYGNLLDINRAILPNGRTDNLSFRSTDVNASDVFTSLREQTRKTIAYHFELNARKPLPLQSVTDSTDYARGRSRFSVDIDKEGQFKINVPASSEVGNVPLLTRYENYTTLRSAEDEDADHNEFVRNVDNQDIFCESHGVGVISLTRGDDTIQGFAAPSDRNTDQPIKLGTAFHDITNTVALHKSVEYVNNYITSGTKIPVAVTEDIVSTNITISGDDANAGGRSGTISLDGMLSLNIGANTVDRQSMWIDTAGGIIANIGRDKNNISYAATLDGDMFIQIGAASVANDSRFGENNAARPGAIDIRVLAGAGNTASSTMHVIRIDATGVRIATPGEVDIVAETDLKLKSERGNVWIDGESIFMYSSNPRLVERNKGTIK